tara:strand:- start:1010 stop:1537 length:528 start_codon:yes stop_codon:yes gene_type:complete
MANLPRHCNKCNVLLDDSNSHPPQLAARLKISGHICKSCQARRVHEHKSRSLKDDPVLYRCKKILCAAKGRARKSNREFSLTLDDLLELAKQPSCPISRRPFFWRTVIGNPKTRGPHPDAPSLDRIDSSRGYTPDNVWLISHRMNAIKSNATPEELKLVSDTVFLKVMENYLDSL